MKAFGINVDSRADIFPPGATVSAYVAASYRFRVRQRLKTRQSLAPDVHRVQIGLASIISSEAEAILSACQAAAFASVYRLSVDQPNTLNSGTYN